MKFLILKLICLLYLLGSVGLCFAAANAQVPNATDQNEPLPNFVTVSKQMKVGADGSVRQVSPLLGNIVGVGVRMPEDVESSDKSEPEGADTTNKVDHPVVEIEP